MYDVHIEWVAACILQWNRVCWLCSVCLHGQQCQLGLRLACRAYRPLHNVQATRPVSFFFFCTILVESTMFHWWLFWICYNLVNFEQVVLWDSVFMCYWKSQSTTSIKRKSFSVLCGISPVQHVPCRTVLSSTMLTWSNARMPFLDADANPLRVHKKTVCSNLQQYPTVSWALFIYGWVDPSAPWTKLLPHCSKGGDRLCTAARSTSIKLFKVCALIKRIPVIIYGHFSCY